MVVAGSSLAMYGIAMADALRQFHIDVQVRVSASGLDIPLWGG